MFTPRRGNSSGTPTRWTPQKILHNDLWISLDEAKDRVHGKVEWWKCPNIEGEQIEFLQTPHPVWSNGTKMYVGGWQKHHKKAYFQWHGPGVYYRQDGRILVGKWVDGKLKGLAKRLWCPESPCWQENRKADSVIKDSQKQGLPFIYIGKYKGHCKEDKHAIVILKDGTTRIGPWKRNSPVGDWWNEHEKGFTTPEEISRILGFDQLEVNNNLDVMTDEGSQASTVVTKNTTKLAAVKSQMSKENETDVSDAGPNTTVIKGKDIVRRIHLEPEPDVSEVGEEMPGTALAHTIEDDEEEIVFMEGDCVDASFDSNESHDSYDVRTPPRTNHLKEMSVDDPHMTPIDSPNDIRGTIIRKDLPQKLLFASTSDEDVTHVTIDQDQSKSDPLNVIFSGEPSERFIERMKTEDVPKEYNETSSRKGHNEAWMNRTGDTATIHTPAITESSTMSPHLYSTYDHRENTYNMDQLSALVDWLMTDVIGSSPSRIEMEQYARQFLDVGLHSSLMITSSCTIADAANFSWMKPFHRRCFVLWAHKHCKNDYQRQFVSITTWLQFEVIGNDADILEMGFYARKLVSAGFHSVKMIQAVCTYDDVDAFDWMKPVHKRLFLSKVGVADA